MWNSWPIFFLFDVKFAEELYAQNLPRIVLVHGSKILLSLTFAFFSLKKSESSESIFSVVSEYRALEGFVLLAVQLYCYWWYCNLPGSTFNFLLHTFEIYFWSRCSSSPLQATQSVLAHQNNNSSALLCSPWIQSTKPFRWICVFCQDRQHLPQ